MDVATAVEHVAVARSVDGGRGEVSGQHVVAVDGGVEVLEVVCSRERLSEHACRERGRQTDTQTEAVRSGAQRGYHKNMVRGRLSE